MEIEGLNEDEQGQQDEKSSSSGAKKEEILSFRCVNRILDETDVGQEFALMRSFLSKVAAPADFHRVGMGSGTHLLKLTTPRSDVSQSILRFGKASSNSGPAFVPSLNAPDIPFAKIVYRPLEILGRPPRSLLDHIQEPDEISDAILNAFAKVFGIECLDALRSALLGEGQHVVNLPDTGEFPIIFLPSPAGGDIQATPVSPAVTFMGFKNMASGWFLKQEKDAPPVPRGHWIKQSISAKPQNISGAIGGPRQRFLAEMPTVMRDYDAAILRHARGGSFPMWRDEEVEAAVLHYAGRLGKEYTNSDIRAGTDWYADQLISGALDFIAEVRSDVCKILESENSADKALPEPPHPSALILRRRWKREDREVALMALTSGHFRDRERIARKKLED
jgi:hypothetical protein